MHDLYRERDHRCCAARKLLLLGTAATLILRRWRGRELMARRLVFSPASGGGSGRSGSRLFRVGERPGEISAPLGSGSRPAPPAPFLGVRRARRHRRRYRRRGGSRACRWRAIVISPSTTSTQASNSCACVGRLEIVRLHLAVDHLGVALLLQLLSRNPPDPSRDPPGFVGLHPSTPRRASNRLGCGEAANNYNETARQ